MLKTTIADITLDCCIYNASGPRTGSIEALQKVAESKSGAILSKSSTLRKQDGNSLPRFINKIDIGRNYCQGSINSEGLPNAGIDYYISEEATKSLSSYGKPYIISISGLNLNDNLEMLTKIYSSQSLSSNNNNITAIELNLACPNIIGKPIIAYDFEQMEVVLEQVTSLPNYHTIPCGIKLPPYFDISYYEKIISIIIKYPIRYIVTMNTVGNVLYVNTDDECEGIVPNHGRGGLGGGFVKYIALANVNIIYKLLKEKGRDDIDIVGVGGVHSGKDAFDLILCGAKAVQVATCHWIEGPSCFERISNELKLIMIEKGYSCIEDFRGKLKPYQKPTKKEHDVKGVSTNDDDNNNNDVDDRGKVSLESNTIIIYTLMSIIVILLAIIGVLSSKLNEYY